MCVFSGGEDEGSQVRRRGLPQRRPPRLPPLHPVTNLSFSRSFTFSFFELPLHHSSGCRAERTRNLVLLLKQIHFWLGSVKEEVVLSFGGLYIHTIVWWNEVLKKIYVHLWNIFLIGLMVLCHCFKQTIIIQTQTNTKKDWMFYICMHNCNRVCFVWQYMYFCLPSFAEICCE